MKGGGAAADASHMALTSSEGGPRANASASASGKCKEGGEIG